MDDKVGILPVANSPVPEIFTLQSTFYSSLFFIWVANNNPKVRETLVNFHKVFLPLSLFLNIAITVFFDE